MSKEKSLKSKLFIIDKANDDNKVYFLNCDKSNPRNILTNIPGFLLMLVSDAAFSIENLFAI